MKKIAHFIDTIIPGGAEVLIIEISRNLRKYNYQPEVFHFGNPWLVEKCAELDIPCVLVPGHEYYKSIKKLPLFTLKFIRFLKERKISLLHSHLFAPITGSCFATFIGGVPHVGTMHDTYTIEEKKSRIHLLRVASIITTQLVTVSEDMREYLRSLGKFNGDSLKLIWNGVDLDRYSSPHNSLRLELGLELSEIVFICVGRLVKIKGHDILIEAFSKIRSNEHVKLLIVGDGPNRGMIEKLIDEKNMGKQIQIVGFRNDVPALLGLSDCFVLSSRSEGLSCSIEEAMASGLPLIVTDVGGNRELVIDGECGYLVAANDPDSFAKKMQIMIDNKEKRLKFGEMSRVIAQEKFSIASMVEKYINIYQKML